MAFTLPKPVAFGDIISGKTAADAAGPAPLTTKASARRVAQIAAAGEVLTTLPSPGETIHTLLLGRFDLTDVVDVLLTRLGPCRLTIATLSFNQRNTREILGWLDSKRVTSLALLSSSFHRDHNPDLFTSFRDDLRQRGARLAADRCHAKIIVVSPEAGSPLVIETSANLRNNGNFEFATITNDAALAQWHATWIEARVTAREGDESGDTTTD